MMENIHKQGRVAPPANPESFKAYASKELSFCKINIPGECYYPDCSKRFDCNVEAQIYCSKSCKALDTAERRKWGLRMADAALYWRTWKFTKDPAKAAVVRAARRYITMLQSEWRNDRCTRKVTAQARRSVL